MRPDAVILYGPPASGKDTVTAALAALADRYTQFDRLKVGANARAPYRAASAGDLDRLQAEGSILYANERYGNVYAIDRPRLDELTAASRVPVVHLGQVAGIHALHAEYPARWLTVLLWCPRDITATRARQRGSTDVAERLTAWDETQTDLATATADLFDLVLRTDQRPPDEAAVCIHRALAEGAGAVRPERDEVD
ncbi:putative guanylate kinase [Frankia canadensis]|uniref:Putative guanylate kinase n=1 Tax=Frankia canadensis TaxID=1836972 RepID=A0A2I2L183_9ACTN|nr:guanylate kinase [Frankia canadensis]SNQ51659.1 putative guanylate kinase [Frankia canadensis]SOU58949.1 putative guanylate kinase [Frankia canadensis]